MDILSFFLKLKLKLKKLKVKLKLMLEHFSSIGSEVLLVAVEG